MTLRSERRLSLLPWLALALLLAATWLCYHPGLRGGFLFDDFVNLPALGASGPVDNAAAFWRYITSGTADPTGRPLALLSFLIDARDWPAGPEPFLRTNVLLHLLNTALLFALLRNLGRWLDGQPSDVILSEAKDLLSGRGPEQRQSRSFAAPRMTGIGGTPRMTGTGSAPGTTITRTDAAALLGAGLWALHPLLVSTTLYVVQREAMLPATFTLLALLAWLHGRRLLGQAPRAGLAWMILAIGLGTVLAMLSKANGVLLPLLVWIVDALLLPKPPGDAPTRRAMAWVRGLLLVVPSLCVLAYLLARLPQLDAVLDSRPWTIGQRLLTEPRVLLDYLHLLLVPRVLSTGLYNDGYQASTSLWAPATTLPALLVVASLVVGAFALRKRTPALSAALLFYFAGHLVESTTLPLELYFEHRNYLPALLLGWPLARAVCRWQVPAWGRTAAGALLLGILAITTWQRASLWADREQMALLWAAGNPTSARAQATAASFESRTGHAGDAIQRLSGPWRERPYDLQLALNYVNAACTARGLTANEIDAVASALRNARHGDQLLYEWLVKALVTARNGQCPGLDLDVIAGWLDAASANPYFSRLPGRRQDLHSMKGRLALVEGDRNTALREFNLAIDASPRPQAAAMQSALLASSGALPQALAHLDHYAAIRPRDARAHAMDMQGLHAWVLERQGFWNNELAQLRHTIRADLDAASRKAGK